MCVCDISSSFLPPFCSYEGAFDDDKVVHVEGDVNPVRDLQIISEELMFKDIEYLNKQIAPLEKTVGRGGEKKRKFEYVGSIFIV